MTTKDWLTLAISILALLISAATAYLTVWRKVEHVECSVLKAPIVRLSKEGIFVAGMLELAFMNLGSRAIVVMRTGLRLNQSGNVNDGCFGTAIEDIEFISENFVLQPGEITLKCFKPTDPGKRIKLAGGNLLERKHLVAVGCVQMTIITSRGYSFAAFRFGYYTDVSEGTPANLRRKPSVVINRRLPVFLSNKSPPAVEH